MREREGLRESVENVREREILKEGEREGEREREILAEGIKREKGIETQG